jgi:hypothetical protein
MAQVTLRVIDGADRGKVFENVDTPLTIGREEGNTVQLNDERISRFHIKIQVDQDRLVLTDLESTNGTRVNGQQTQLRILRFGDVIGLGRSQLLYGTREQIAARLDDLRASGIVPADELEGSSLARHARATSDDLSWTESGNLRSTLHIPSVPELPEGLSPGQAAQISELIEYLHLRAHALSDHARVSEDEREVTMSIENWQEILDLQSVLAEYVRKIGEPGSE